MSYPIAQIEGIGEVYAAKLKAVGIVTVENLLEKCATAKGRTALEEETGIGHQLILKWTNHADLMRVNGIAGQFAELLEAAGVDTVKELATRNAENLAAKVAEINEQKNLVNRVPVASEIARMIEDAKALPAVITY